MHPRQSRLLLRHGLMEQWLFTCLFVCLFVVFSHPKANMNQSNRDCRRCRTIGPLSLLLDVFDQYISLSAICAIVSAAICVFAVPRDVDGYLKDVGKQGQARGHGEGRNRYSYPWTSVGVSRAPGSPRLSGRREFPGLPYIFPPPEIQHGCSLRYRQPGNKSCWQINIKTKWSGPWENVSCRMRATKAQISLHIRAESDQRLDSVMSLVFVTKISSLMLASVAAQADLSDLVGNSRRHVFSWRGSNEPLDGLLAVTFLL